MENRQIFYNGLRNRRYSLVRKFSITNWIIIANIILFLFAGILYSIFGEEKVTSLIALQANSFFSGNFWTLLTSMFIHANLGHLFFNMISLFFIGNFVEKLIGRKRFFWFYLISGIFAGLFYATLSYFFGGIILTIGNSSFNFGEKLFLSPLVYAVGASGAIFSLVGLLAMLTPYNKVYLIAGPLIAIIIQSLLFNISGNAEFVSLVVILVNVYFIFSIIAMFSFNPFLRKLAIPLAMRLWLLPIVAIVPLVIIGFFIPLPIGNTAHFGGLIVGLFYAFYLKKKYKRKTDLIRRYFSR